MRNPLSKSSVCAVFAAVALLASSLATGEAAAAAGLQDADLSGHWYILVHYKDDRSKDKSITKFKDMAWSIEQTENKIALKAYKYVFLPNEGDELARRNSMTNHLPWEPDERIWSDIREAVYVGARGSKSKTLYGSRASGFRTKSGSSMGIQTLTFTQDWTIRFEENQIVVEVEDSLSGSGGLAGMDEMIVFRLTERVADDEFRGRYDSPTHHGKLWMVRAKNRRGEDDPNKTRRRQARAAEEALREAAREEGGGRR
jgi:hypothetical protein